MAASPNNLGVAAPTLYQPPEEPAGAPVPTTASPAPAWPHSAQLAAGSLLVLCLGLMGWHLLTMGVGATRPSEPVQHLDLNRADRTELRQLPGIGETLARRIEAYRRDHGPFAQIEDLRKVHGIGPATLETFRPFVTVEPVPADEDAEAERPAVPAITPRGKEKPAIDVAPVRGLKNPLQGGRIDVNAATQDELRKLPGIGPKMSERILQTRSLRPFESVDDLRRVPGIGPKTLERLRPFITVTNPADKAALAR